MAGSSVSDDPIVQASNGLEKLSSALTSLTFEMALSKYSDADKRTLQTTKRVADLNYGILQEGFNQMRGMEWNRETLPRFWFNSPQEGWNWWVDLFTDTYRNVTSALGYSDKVNFSGRFTSLITDTKETLSNVVPDKDDYGVISIAIIGLVLVFFWVKLS